MQKQRTPIYKVVIIGEQRVGKTSITLRYVKEKFNQDSPSTIDACFLQKQITAKNKENVKFAIWDTAGQERYNAIAPIYYRDAHAAIIVYQVTNISSFQKMKKWVNQLKKFASEKIIICIAGNKSDLSVYRMITIKQAQQYCKQEKLIQFQVSAKTGKNINLMFQVIADRIYQNIHVQQKVNKKQGEGWRKMPLTINISQPQKQSQKKRRCC